MISNDTLAFLSEPGRRYLLATSRSALATFQKRAARAAAGNACRTIPRSTSSCSSAADVHYLLARSKPRRAEGTRHPPPPTPRPGQGPEETASTASPSGRLKKRDKILEAVGRLKERYPKARPFVDHHASVTARRHCSYTWNVAKFKDGPGPRRRLPAAQQSGRLVGRRSFGKPTSSSRWSSAPSACSKASCCCGRSGITTAAAPRRTSSSACWPTPCGRRSTIWPSEPACMTLIHKPDRSAGQRRPQSRDR